MTHTKRSPDYYGAQRIAKLEALNAELLEALEAAAQSEHHTHCSSRKRSMQCNCHVGKARAAIARAKGES